jgi:Uma2 family endonuclease
MGEKAELYAEFSVAEYCVVDVAARCVHVCADAANNFYQDRGKFTTGQILSPRCRPAASLTLSELFTEN